MTDDEKDPDIREALAALQDSVSTVDNEVRRLQTAIFGAAWDKRGGKTLCAMLDDNRRTLDAINAALRTRPKRK